MVAEASYGQKFLFPVLCCLLSSALWCHLLLSKNNLDGRSGEGVRLAELYSEHFKKVEMLWNSNTANAVGIHLRASGGDGVAE